MADWQGVAERGGWQPLCRQLQTCRNNSTFLHISVHINSRYEFVGPVASSRVQLRVTRSTLGNNSIVTLHDGEGNPFAPAIGAFFGTQG